MSDALRFRDAFAAMTFALGFGEDDLRAMLPSEIEPPAWARGLSAAPRPVRAQRLAPELARLVVALEDARFR